MRAPLPPPRSTSFFFHVAMGAIASRSAIFPRFLSRPNERQKCRLKAPDDRHVEIIVVDHGHLVDGRDSDRDPAHGRIFRAEETHGRTAQAQSAGFRTFRAVPVRAESVASAIFASSFSHSSRRKYDERRRGESGSAPNKRRAYVCRNHIDIRV